jgi:eukaryotic-like serine/threonine-protein kinase
MTRLRASESFQGNERFQVISTLGRGGMGVVYSVYDRERQAKVALKTLNEGSPLELMRLKNEFRALQELDHPNLVSLGELFEEDGRWFFTMELVEGEDFITHVRLEEEEPGGLFTGGDTFEGSGARIRHDAGRLLFDEKKLRDGLVQLLGALGALHATGRVHRDIKPDNVLVQPDGRVVLLDFGLVTQSDPGQLSVHYNPVGTAAYMAPEQAAGLAVGPEADWYSVGVLLFEALTGTPPFTGTFNQILLAKHGQEAPRPRALQAVVPEDLDALCVGLLSHDPSLRPHPEETVRILRGGRRGVDSRQATVGTRIPVFVGRRREMAWLSGALRDVAEPGTGDPAALRRVGAGQERTVATGGPGDAGPGLAHSGALGTLQRTGVRLVQGLRQRGGRAQPLPRASDRKGGRPTDATERRSPGAGLPHAHVSARARQRGREPEATR